MDDTCWQKLLRACLELPQRPFIVVAGDFSQLQPIGGGRMLRTFCENRIRHHITLESNFRTGDNRLLDFLNKVRDSEVDKRELRSFFGPAGRPHEADFNFRESREWSLPGAGDGPRKGEQEDEERKMMREIVLKQSLGVAVKW